MQERLRYDLFLFTMVAGKEIKSLNLENGISLAIFVSIIDKIGINKHYILQINRKKKFILQYFTDTILPKTRIILNGSLIYIFVFIILQ